MQRSNVTSF